MIKEGIKVKSWAMVKAAIKEIEEKNINLNTNKDSWTHEIIPQTELNIPDAALPATDLDKIKHKNPPNKKTNSKNLFYDDGKVTKIGDLSIDSAQADRKIKYKPPIERNRVPYKQKYIKCTKCSKKYEVSDLEYAYYKNPMNEADYICQNCT